MVVKLGIPPDDEATAPMASFFSFGPRGSAVLDDVS